MTLLADPTPDTNGVATTPGQARRARIRSLEDLQERIRNELTGLYRLEGYQPTPRVPTLGVRTVLDRRNQTAEAIARRAELAQVVPGKVVNEWAVRTGRRAAGIRGGVPTALREEFILEHPHWSPDTPLHAPGEPAEIRAWCWANGVPVNTHGAICRDARAAYDEAHQGDQ